LEIAYSGSRLSEIQEPHPNPLLASEEGAYDVSHSSAYRYNKPYLIDISGKDCRDVPWNVSTRVSGHAYFIFGDV
jgi:hypothetical protein